MSQRGVSLVQVMAVVAIAGIIILASMPPLREMQESMRLDAASRRVLSDVRSARSLAVTTGWQYRFAGSTTTASYRILARKSTAVAWPASEVAPFSSATQIATPWTDFGGFHPGIKLRPFDPGAPSEYWISFDSRGAPIDASEGLLPLAIMNIHGSSRLVNVSPTGRMFLE